MSTDLENINYCRELVRKDDPDSYLLSLFAPHEHQRGLWALYAFNQELAKIRESVSEPMLGEIRIQWWQDVLEELARGEVREQPVIQEISLLFANKNLANLLSALLSARKDDLLGENQLGFDGLTSYATGVGGSLYLTAASIQIPEISETGIKAARKLGSAWAMLGLVRALPHSWQVNSRPLTEAMADANEVREAQKAYELLAPTIAQMLEYVDRELSSALKLKDQMSKKEKRLLLKATQIRIHRSMLKEAGDNPFELPKHDFTVFKKLCTFIWVSITGRY